jgi:hypothetical protein
MNEELLHIKSSVHEVFEISVGEDYNSAELLEAISIRVQELFDQDPGLLFSYLYRLDVSELKVRAIMNNETAHKVKSIAKLIYDRQLQRYHTKKTIIQKPIKGFEW